MEEIIQPLKAILIKDEKGNNYIILTTSRFLHKSIWKYLHEVYDANDDDVQQEGEIKGISEKNGTWEFYGIKGTFEIYHVIA